MQLEKIEDLLEIQHEKLKVAETKRIITKIKQLIKDSSAKAHKNKLTELPYKGVSVVDNKLVHLEFDLESKEARVIDVEIDSRDVQGRNIMAGAKALDLIEYFVKNQKELK